MSKYIYAVFAALVFAYLLFILLSVTGCATEPKCVTSCPPGERCIVICDEDWIDYD